MIETYRNIKELLDISQRMITECFYTALDKSDKPNHFVKLERPVEMYIDLTGYKDYEGYNTPIIGFRYEHDESASSRIIVFVDDEGDDVPLNCISVSDRFRVLEQMPPFYI